MDGPILVGHICTWLTLSLGAYALFAMTGDVVKADTNKAVASWLLKLDPAGAISMWPGAFVALFSRVFGERHASRRCYVSSAIASLSATVLLLLIHYIRNAESSVLTLAKQEVAGMVFYFVGINLIADYISLFETRIVLQRMKASCSKAVWLGLLLLDLVLTASVFFMVTASLFAAVGYVLDNLNWPWARIQTLVLMKSYLMVLQSDGATLTGKDGLSGVFFYSTFATSVWLWAYSIAVFGVRILSRWSIGLRFLRNHLDIENKPFRAMGFVLSFIITICYLVGVAVV